MTKQRLYWILQTVGWSSWAVVNILGMSYVSTNFTSQMAIPILAESVYFFIITHQLRLFMKKREWLNLATAKLIVRASLSITGMAITVYALRILISYLLGHYGQEMLSAMNILGNVSGNLIILLIWFSVYFVFHYFEKSTQSLKYEVAMNEMKLNQLRTQLNPHFIFNALNSIRALVDDEPGKAKRAINHLSNILRTSLVLDKKKLTSLKEEIDTTRDYLALESVRFEERLRTNINIDPRAEQIMVPPMLLQTLVENGIKHGVSKLKEGGEVSVNVRVKTKKMILEIRNTGTYQKNKINGTGQGLRNSQQRLELIYGDKASLKIKNEKENTVLTTVKIPLNE